MKPLYERTRPKQWSDVTGQDRAVKIIERLRAAGGLSGRVYWITGASGTGKTTIARLIAGECADPYAIVEIDAADLSMDRVREFERMCRVRPIGILGHHAFIVNEAHRLRGDVVSRLLTTFERGEVQATSVWAFTTSNRGGQGNLFTDSADSGPFGSRCINLSLVAGNDTIEVFAERCRQIASAEGLDGKPLSAYVSLARDCKCNLREMLCHVESGIMLD